MIATLSNVLAGFYLGIFFMCWWIDRKGFYERNENS